MQKVTLAVIGVAVASVAGGGMLYVAELSEGSTTSPQIGFQPEYYPGNESLRLTNLGNDSIRPTSVTGKQRAKLYIVVEGPGDRERRARITGGERTSDRGLWVDDAEDAIRNQTSAGDSVLIVSDGTDIDGDGKAGIELGEWVNVRYFEIEYDEWTGPERKTHTLYSVRVCQPLATGTPTTSTSPRSACASVVTTR